MVPQKVPSDLIPVRGIPTPELYSRHTCMILLARTLAWPQGAPTLVQKVPGLS